MAAVSEPVGKTDPFPRTARSWRGELPDPAESRIGSSRIELIMAAVVLIAVSVPFVFPSDPDAPAPGWFGYLLAAGTAIPLIWQRRAPLVCAIVVAGFTVGSVIYDRPGQPMQYGSAVAMFAVAALARPWQRRGLLAAWVGGIVLVSLVTGDQTVAGAGFGVLTVCCAYLIGRLAAGRRDQLAMVRRDAERRERQAELEIGAAAIRERQRIAREMHDVVAHAVSVMIVQAEAGAAGVAAGAPATEEQFDTIADTGRSAIDQLRRTLRVLRDDAVDGTGAGNTDVDPSREADPASSTAPDLDVLVEQFARAGLTVRLDGAAQLTGADAGVSATAYRIIQEALINILRHSRARTASIKISRSDRAVLVEISDPGPLAEAVNRGSGYGLVGMRERAAAHGGTVTAERTAAGGFTVRATLPTRASPPTAPGGPR